MAEGRPRGRPPVPYTEAEIRIMVQGVADGLRYEAIGRKLNPLRPVSYEAVKSRLYKLCIEWGALTRAHMVSIAYQRGVLTVDTSRDTVEVLRAGAGLVSTSEARARPPGHTTTRKVARG